MNESKPNSGWNESKPTSGWNESKPSFPIAMNVNEAMAYASKDKCFWTGEMHIALETLGDEVKRLQAEVQRLDMAGTHSCHDDCQRLPCVQRREIERLRAEVQMWNSFHRVAVKERDFERLLVEALKEELAAAKAASVCPVEMQNEQDGEQIAIKGMSHFYGDLWILKDGDEYFWLFDDYNGGNWQPITKQLYDALLDYNKRAKEADKTPPEA